MLVYIILLVGVAIIARAKTLISTSIYKGQYTWAPKGNYIANNNH